MASVNKVILVGHLGKDPEFRSTQNGSEICNLAVATSNKWTDSNSGEKKEKTEWHRIVIMNDNISGIAKNFARKDSRVYIEGSLQTRKWTDQQGVDRYTTEVFLGRFGGLFLVLDRAESTEHKAKAELASATRAASSPPRQEDKRFGQGNDLDDEIPF